MNVGSLFSGIGGIELGFERAGFHTLWFVERDLYAQTILRKQFPNAKIYEDVTKIDWRAVPKVDVLTGGFPCQDISNAGKRAGIEGSRSLLWKNFCQAIGILRPRYAFIENVSAILGRGLDVVLTDLAEIGYDAEWHCVSASSVGAPHRRDRTFILAYDNGSRCVDRKSAEFSDSGRFEAQPWTVQGCDVPNSNCVRQQGGWGERRGGTLERELEDGIGNETADGTLTSSEDVQHTDFDRLERHRESLECQREQSINTSKTDLRGRGQWVSEPNVGRVADGVPNILYKKVVKYAKSNDKETESEIDSINRQTLRTMWEERELTEAPRGLFCPWESIDSLSRVPQELAPLSWQLGDWIEEDEVLFYLWQGICSKPFDQTQDLQQEMLVRIRIYQCEKAMGQHERVNRIRCLGNAVVPQCAEVFARAIKEYEEGRKS